MVQQKVNTGEFSEFSFVIPGKSAQSVTLYDENDVLVIYMHVSKSGVYSIKCMYICDTLQHNTCPVCRKTLGTPAPDAEETSMREIETTDSSSSDSSDSDANSDSSNDDVVNSGVNDSSPVADGGKDRVASEPAESAADNLDCSAWSIRPDDSAVLAATHQMEQECHRRSRSSSSSSEYSSL